MPRVRAHSWRLVAVVLLTLVAGNLPVVPSPPASAAVSTGTDEPRVGEVVEERTATSKTVRNENGSMTTSVFTGAVNYRDGRGRWHPISSKLVATDEPGFQWRNQANAFDVSFKERAVGDYLRLNTAGGSFSFALAGAAGGTADAKGSALSYANVLDGVDLKYEVRPDGLKETLVLRRATVPTTYQFFLRGAPVGMEARRQEDGSWAFFMAPHAEPVFTLDAPYAVEAGRAESPAPVSPTEPRHADLNVSPLDDGFAVELSVDADWLGDSERRFPVFLDPTLTIQPTQEDTYFIATCSYCTPWSSDRLYIGTGDIDAYRAALLFSLSAVPAGAVVTEAKLNLYNDGWCIGTSGALCGGTSHTIEAHRMTQPWTTSSTTSQIAFDPVVLSTATYPNGGPLEWKTWDITGTVKDWLSATQPNYGLLMKRSTEPLGASGPVPPSRRSAEPTLMPKLVITYTSDAVELLSPPTLHSNGADLQWTKYTGPSGAPFEKYEVHRSQTANFTPSASTLLATIRDVAVTSYRDTTAAPNATFSYKVVANTKPSNDQRVTLPSDGQATKLLQPGPEGKQTFLTYSSQVTTCGNYGKEDKMWLGTTSTTKYRPVLQFDLKDVPAGASVSSAKLSLWHPFSIKTGVTVNAHRITSSWKEGTGLSTCTNDGATWYERYGDVNWATNGADFESTAGASITNALNEGPSWDEFDITSVAQKWVNGQAPNYGVVLKLSNETLANNKDTIYYSDDFLSTPTLRPKLAMSYSDGSHAQGPTVSVNSPTAGSQVRGTAVNISAAASDDRRVDKVEFLVDGSVVGSATTAPFSTTWNSTTVGNGTHTITARGTDDAGNTSTSAGVSVQIANYAPPTTSITVPTGGSTVSGTVTVTATASAAVGTTISKVEFYADGNLFGTSTGPVYSASWNTLDPTFPFYDGTHALTSKAYDATGQSTTSSAVTVTVANSAGTPYIGTITPVAGTVPQAMVYKPGASQDRYPVDVTVKNDSAGTWSATNIYLRYRWLNPADNTVVVDSAAPGLPIPGGDLAKGRSATFRVDVYPPALPDGTNKAQYLLRFDLFETSTNTFFASKGNPPSDNPVIINKILMDTGLGLERYYQYQREDMGAGMPSLVNVANGNSLLTWRPLSQPGKGLWTVLSLTYNSLEDHSESPLGNNFSLSISTLTRFGLPLDIHPNKADEIAGRSNKYIEFTDGDGTPFRFDAANTAGTVYKEPSGVHLYLRVYSTTDANKKWALTRPDGVTFFYDTEGFPTEVQDRFGNRLKFTLSAVHPSDDPGGVRKQITAVTDEAGLGATPAPNRSFNISYYTKDDAKKPQIRGKIKRITDHSGHALEFTYYEDGNLLRITQKGGQKADGSALADRTFVFTYTTSDGSGPAIPNAADRVNPDPKTPNQSTRLYSVRDPRGKETIFAYYTSGLDKWKLRSRTNRREKTTSFVYDITNRITTVTEPLSRVTKYAYDELGQARTITNPKNEVTTLTWTPDRQMESVTEPGPNQPVTRYSYNDNGYLTSETDQVGNTTKLEYRNDPIDDDPVGLTDVSANWKPGRSIPHRSLLIKKTDPMGVATTTPTDDFQWDFEYDEPENNLIKVTQPRADNGQRYTTEYTPNPDGTVRTMLDRNRNSTSFVYDENGLVSQVTDAESQVTKFGYDNDGQLLWIQDPLHQNPPAGTAEPTYRTKFYYDAFHRLNWQSTPKMMGELAEVIWTSTDYDANDNVASQTDAKYGPEFAKGPESTFQYNNMDALIQAENPGSNSGRQTSTYDYDDADRLIKAIRPNGVATSTEPDDFAMSYTYDELDRVIKQTQYVLDAGVKTPLRTLFCFDTAGDLIRQIAPKAKLDWTAANCPNPKTPSMYATDYTYDAAHKPLSVSDPLGHTQSVLYDANGRVFNSTDAEGHSTRFYFDERGLRTKVVEPFTTGRDVTTKSVYDGVGNVKELISPRAWDKSTDKVAFVDYVTKNTYDRVNRLTKIELPSDTTTLKAYVHREYDANGNLKTVTLPDYSATLSGVPENSRTTLEYFDTGWIRTSNDHVNPPVHFDYDATGLQSLRAPETADGGTLDPNEQLSWEYYDNRLLQFVTDQQGNKETYTYDLDDNLLSARDEGGVTTSDQSAMTVEMDPYDWLDRLTRVKSKKDADSAWKYTSYTYDENSNVETQTDNATDVAGSGVVHTYTYDEADWLKTQVDDNGTDTLSDDQKILNFWWPTGWERERQVQRYASGFGTKQTTQWEWFDNGLLKTLTTKRGGPNSSTVFEKHNVRYEDQNGIYVNGHRTRDEYGITGPSATACPDVTEPLTCVAKYTYDARDRLTTYDDGRAGTYTYELDAIGNVKKQVTPTAATTFTYEGAQTKTRTDSAGTHNYFYDSLGNLDCIMAAAYSKCPDDSGKTGLELDYTYDYLSRLDAYAAYSSGTKTDSADYTYDALDRLVKESETHSGATPRTTTFTHLGLSDLITREVHKNTSTGATLTTKSYSYDAYGNRISMTDDPAGTTAPTPYTYGYDVHGSASLLANVTAGQTVTVKASYGYDPYGNKDTGLTKGDGSMINPYNPFRYSAKRFDSGSQTVDTGARRFSSGSLHFLQQDRFMGALDDLSLTTDPLTNSRYALAGGNPVSYMEWDGHYVILDGKGRGGHSPNPGGSSGSGSGGLYTGAREGGPYRSSGQQTQPREGSGSGWPFSSDGAWIDSAHIQRVLKEVQIDRASGPDVDLSDIWREIKEDWYGSWQDGPLAPKLIGGGLILAGGGAIACAAAGVTACVRLGQTVVSSGSGAADKVQGAGRQIVANQAAGNAARDAIATRYAAARTEVSLQTELGVRRIDVLTQERLAIESKVGYTSLTRTVQSQIAKDQLLRQSGQVTDLRWVFSASGVTGRAGPSNPLAAALGGARIPWFVSP